jgi:hypothetical protein
MKKRLICVCFIGLFLAGCATSIKDINENYGAMSSEIKAFADLTAQDWLFGSGIIQGALPEDAVPKWVFDELRKVDAWAEAGGFTEAQLGYMIGVRFRLAGPVVKAAMEVYAPALLGVNEVASVLAFLGL